MAITHSTTSGESGEIKLMLFKVNPPFGLIPDHNYCIYKMARTLHTNQSNVSRIEKRTDMYISTLRSVIKAMGGDLEVIARFPDGVVRINQFEDIR